MHLSSGLVPIHSWLRRHWIIAVCACILLALDGALVVRVRQDLRNTQSLKAFKSLARNDLSFVGPLDIYDPGGRVLSGHVAVPRALVLFRLHDSTLAEEIAFWHTACRDVSKEHSVRFIGFCESPRCAADASVGSPECLEIAGFSSIVLGRAVGAADIAQQFLVVAPEGRILRRARRTNLESTIQEVTNLTPSSVNAP